MSHIKNIEIKNFKSVRHAKIEDCRRVNVFIGYPNVGKSNILEAMSLASFEFYNQGRSISLKDLCRYKELIGLYNDGNKQKEIEITVNEFIYLLEYVDPHNIQYGIFEKNSVVSSDKFDVSKASKRISINQAGSFSPIITRTDKKHPDFHIKKYQFKTSNNYIRNNPVKLDYPFGENLFEIIRYNGELRKECGELFNAYNLKLAFDEESELEIQKHLDEYSVFKIPMLQVSDTLQRVMFYKAAIKSNSDGILLFEEPEAHMFPPYIAKFNADVMYDKNNNQFFIATHSPFVLNDFMEDMEKEDLAIYAVGYLKGETTINRLTDKQVTDIYQYGVDLFFNLEEFLKDVVS